MLIFTQKKPRLLRHFKKDPVLFAYHIGDLDDFYFSDCQWAGDYDGSHVLREVILVYTGLETPTVLCFGLSEVMHELLESMLPLLPARFYCHFLPQYRDQLIDMYRVQRLGSFIKMKLVDFKPVDDSSSADMMRLNSRHETDLRELYEKAYPGNYFTPRMLQTGKYFGWYEDNRLVCVAGVHVSSDEYKVAVLGNIATHPDYRGRGLAGRVTSRLVSELNEEDKLVCLNVKADNDTAIRCYQRLGFEKTHEYEEALCRLPGA